MMLELPPEIPYGFVALPQYETERLLREHLAGLGLEVERGVALRSFEQDADGVTAVLAGPEGEETVRTRYLIGCRRRPQRRPQGAWPVLRGRRLSRGLHAR